MKNRMIPRVSSRNQLHILCMLVLCASLNCLCFSFSTHASTYTASLSTSGNVTLNVITSATGDTVATGNDTLTATTTCPNGYILQIYTSESPNLYNGGVNTGGTYIAPVSGVNQALTQNTWGYSLTDDGYYSGLSTTPTDLGTISSTFDGTTSYLYSDTTATNATIPVYYGVKVANTLPPGAYTMENNGAIVYTMTINPSCMGYTVSFDSNGGTGTMDNQIIYEGLPTNLTANGFTAPANHEFKEWNTDPDGNGDSYSDEQSVTDIANPTETIQLYAIWQLKSYTCTKQYRLQNANGTYPDNYTSDGTETITHGSTCSYSKSVTDYQTQSTSITMTEPKTLSLDLPRNTYALTINRNTTYISSVSGAGSHRWGEVVSISATLASNSLFNGWSQTAGTTGSFASTSSASTTFTMGKGAATIYADGSAKIYMQNLPSSQCTTTAKTVYDNRDETPYRIQRLADGKCWMLDNLALDLVANKNNLNASNTNASNTTLSYLKNGGGSGQFTGTAIAYAGSKDTYNTPQVAVSGTCQDEYCVDNPSSGNWTSDAVTSPTISGFTSIAQGKIGAYYNYCAASAGSYCYASSSGTGDATEDICPAHWRLPTGGSSGEFNTLYATGYSSNGTNFQTALQTPLSGHFASGKAWFQGHFGYIWSSTRDNSNSNSMYILNVYPWDVYTSYSNIRNRGYSVRCILSAS